MTREDLARLRRIADLRLDLRLSALRKAGAACAATEGRIAEVEENLRAALSTDWADPRGAGLYETWAGGQQRQLNMVLARQRVEQEREREAAARAFGQSEALRRIAEREEERRRLEAARRRSG